MVVLCPKGHDMSVGLTQDRRCIQCHRDRDARWKKRHRAQYVAGLRRYYLKNADKMAARTAAWKAKHPERQKAFEAKWRNKYKGVNFWVEAAKESA